MKSVGQSTKNLKNIYIFWEYMLETLDYKIHSKSWKNEWAILAEFRAAEI